LNIETASPQHSRLKPVGFCPQPSTRPTRRHRWRIRDWAHIGCRARRRSSRGSLGASAPSRPLGRLDRASSGNVNRTSLRPLETVDVALVAVCVTHVQLTNTTMGAAAAQVQWARLSALLEDLHFRGRRRLLPRCWSLPSRSLAFGAWRRLLLLRHVVLRC
jgi:hypothetical protein